MTLLKRVLIKQENKAKNTKEKKVQGGEKYEKG